MSYLVEYVRHGQEADRNTTKQRVSWTNAKIVKELDESRDTLSRKKSSTYKSSITKGRPRPGTEAASCESRNERDGRIASRGAEYSSCGEPATVALHFQPYASHEQEMSMRMHSKEAEGRLELSHLYGSSIGPVGDLKSVGVWAVLVSARSEQGCRGA